jgi:hypothetical protein
MKRRHGTEENSDAFYAAIVAADERAEQAAVVHGAVCCCSAPFERDGVAYVAWSPSCQIHTRESHEGRA